MSNDQWHDVVESRETQRRKKRQAVIEAGVRLFNENGFEKTSLDDLAKSLGITKRTIYYYVQNKDEILMEALRQSMQVLERIARTVENDTCSAINTIEVIIDEYARWITTDLGACLVLTSENMLTDEVRVELRATKHQLDWLIRRAVIEGIEVGEIRSTCDPRLTSAAIFGALNWVPYWNRGSTQTLASEISDQFKRSFVQGLRR